MKYIGFHDTKDLPFKKPGDDNRRGPDLRAVDRLPQNVRNEDMKKLRDDPYHKRFDERAEAAVLRSEGGLHVRDEEVVGEQERAAEGVGGKLAAEVVGELGLGHVVFMTPRLDEMLERAADYLEREFDRFTATALSLLEPAIIVLMGGIVATIVLSILLPILQLNTLAGQ